MLQRNDIREIKYVICIELIGNEWVVFCNDVKVWSEAFDDKDDSRKQLIDKFGRRYAPCDICAWLKGKKYELYRCIAKGKKPVFCRVIPDGII